MFPFSKRTPKAKPKSTGHQLLNRSLALGAGLLLLWLALNLIPKPSSANQPVIYSDAAGTVATSSSITNAEPGDILDWGKIAAGLLLAGLITFGIVWQRKSPKNQLSAASLQSLEKIQINPNQHVHLISCGQDALLIGTSNANITLLHQFPIHHLNKLEKANTEKANMVDIINAPPYSTPSSTLYKNPDFGILLQQKHLTTPEPIEATKAL